MPRSSGYVASGTQAVAEQHTFLFADLAGYTALTEAHGDERAADVAASFFKQVRELLPDYGAEEVKSIGDALMLRATDPAGAVRLGVRIVDEFGAKHDFPHIRAGMHTGPAVVRGDDWFGATVNIASRVAALANEGEVLVTKATRDAVAEAHPEVELLSRGPKRLRNVREPVELFVAVPRSGESAHGYPLDPVCRMGVDPASAPEHEAFKGHDYYFCSPACHTAFRQDPYHYTRGGRRSDRLDLRVSEDSRERAAGHLRGAFRKGRIDDQELEERVGRVWGAKTRGELAAVLADLPDHRRRALRGWRGFWRVTVSRPFRLAFRFLTRPLRRRRWRS